MDFSDMKPFKNMLLEVADKLSDCVQEMEESNVRTKKSHEATKKQEFVIEDFIVANIKIKKMYISIQLGTITSLRSTKVLEIVPYINRL